MKKPSTVIAAEASLSAKKAEVTAAEDALHRLKAELAWAYAAVTNAQTEADASLPQCRMVSVSRYDHKEDGGARYVILRRTPTGMLVVRRVGDAGGYESKFKWSARSEVYREVVKHLWGSDSKELRDVPAQYLSPVPSTKQPETTA